jgi:lysophospholipid acyltransferase (LPLAT)-like uncharacterized protein
MREEDQIIYSVSGFRRLILLPLALFIRIWGATLRFEITAESKKTFERQDKPIAFIQWHNRLFLAPQFYSRYRGNRPMYGLVSASKDGAWLAALFSLVGMRAIRGSSSRMGKEAAQAVIHVLKQGSDVGITPDGPRGPCYSFKAGAVVVTRRANATMLLVGAEFKSARRLKSWDQFYLPLPFSHVKIHCEEVDPRAVEPEQIAARLREINPD